MFTTKAYESDFDAIAISIFNFQFQFNDVYRQFCLFFKVRPSEVKSLIDIPFLPIQFFKSKDVKTGNWDSELVFRSSGTSQSVTSKHHIYSQNWYLNNAIEGFGRFYGDPKDYAFIAILPGYYERPDSSLINMVKHFIRLSKYDSSGFYLNKEEEMMEVLNHNKVNSIPSILFGVSFGLLELSRFTIDFPEMIVIETGGMKSSTLEMNKDEIIAEFTKAWTVKRVDSEYGMTELQSQAYALDSRWYQPANTMKVFIGQLYDPKKMERPNKAGNIKVIDLANIDSCAFIETQDLGMHNGQGMFKVLGRMESTELRGCNLLLEDVI